jgi:hypothetical protein
MLTTNTQHPLNYALLVAKLLESDVIAAGQVKEHISRERLLELLDIEPEIKIETEYVEHETVGAAISKFSDDEILQYMKRQFSKSEILELVT